MKGGNMRTRHLVHVALCAVVALGLGVFTTSCAGKVKITKTAKTMIGDETVQWDGSASITAPGGYNQAELKKLLKKSGIDGKKLAVAITRDVRSCNLNTSSVEVAGSYAYDGFKENFDYNLNESHPVPIPIDTPKNITKRCNKTASKAVAMGIARSLRDADKL
jgi:hypothetical protein